MKAELILFGKSLDMTLQSSRRKLVAMIYVGLAALMICLWFVDHWHVSGVYLVFVTVLVNRTFLGGYYFGGLVKPFNGKPPSNSDAPPLLLMLKLRMYRPVLEPEDRVYRNDERELHQRDRAHYQAYRVAVIALLVSWLVVDMKLYAARLLAWVPVSPDLLLFGLLLATVVTAFTLPQAILLWTEPDMEPESEIAG